MAKARPAAFWFYGNEKFIFTVVAIALGTSGFVVGDSISDATSDAIRKGRFSWGKTFTFQSRNLHSSPYISEKFLPIKDDAGNVLCIARIRTHENGYVSILGVRVNGDKDEPLEVDKPGKG